MLNIYLLRHGETSWNADGNRYCGLTDLELTEKGILQAQFVGKQLQGISFDAVYASPLKRAVKTAYWAGGNKNIITDKRLIEADFGKWEGKTKEVFIGEDPQIWKEWSDDPMNTKAGGTGETASEIITRVDDFYRSVVMKYDTGNILVVAHNGINRLYLSYKLGMNPKDYRKLHLDNASVTLFTLDKECNMTLYRLNSYLK